MIRKYFNWSIGAFSSIGDVPRGHAFVKESIEQKYDDQGYTCSMPQFGSETLNLHMSYLEGPDGEETQLSKIIAEYGIELKMGAAVAFARQVSPPYTIDGTNYGYAYYDSINNLIKQDTTNTTDSMTVYETIPVTSSTDADLATLEKIQATVLTNTNGVEATQDQLKITREILIALIVKLGYKTEIQGEMTVAEADAFITNLITLNSSINTIISDGQTAKTSAGV